MSSQDRKKSFTKQPFEQFLVAFGFEDDLASGETISSVTIVEIDLATLVAPVPTILEGSSIIGTVASDGKTMTVEANGTDVGQEIKAGADTGRYKVSFRITTSTGRKFEADVVMAVTEE